jgi:hypothetical protein
MHLAHQSFSHWLGVVIILQSKRSGVKFQEMERLLIG